MTLRSSFYLTLPSNVKPGAGASLSNQIGHYKTILPERLALTDDWEVGMVSILYSRTWLNIPSGFFNYATESLPPTMGDVRGQYESIEKVIAALKERLVASPIAFKYLTDENKVEIVIPNDGSELTLYSDLAYTLGFNPYGVLRGGTHKSDYPCNLDAGLSSIFIYADIVEAQVVGDTFAQLLQIAPVKGDFGTTVKVEFNPIIYIPIRVHDIPSITLNLSSESGNEITFTSGKVIAQLHFRRRGLFH
jgi:hypothetical protein